MTRPNPKNHRDQTRQDVTLVTTNDAAKIIGIHPQTMARWARRGVVPAYIVGRGFRFDLEEVLDALRTRAA